MLLVTSQTMTKVMYPANYHLLWRSHGPVIQTRASSRVEPPATALMLTGGSSLTTMSENEGLFAMGHYDRLGTKAVEAWRIRLVPEFAVVVWSA